MTLDPETRGEAIAAFGAICLAAIALAGFAKPDGTEGQQIHARAPHAALIALANRADMVRP